jgi:hypothetical protein
MSDQDPASAQAEVSIDASPDNVYALITDLPTLASLAEEAAALQRLKEKAEARLGSPCDLVGDDGDGRRRSPAACLMPVGGLVRQVHAAHADPAQRLGFPVA